MRAIFLDEEHHHYVLGAMAKELRTLPAQRPPLEEGCRADLVKLIEELIQHEELTIDNCSALKAQFTQADNELFAAVTEALISDSQKHKRLLPALEEVLAAAENAHLLRRFDGCSTYEKDACAVHSRAPRICCHTCFC